MCVCDPRWNNRRPACILLCHDCLHDASLNHWISVHVRVFGRPLCACLSVRLPVCVSVRPSARPSLLLRGCIPPRQYFYFQEVLAAKQCIMQANAELHQSVLAKQKKRFGEEISRLQVRCRQPRRCFASFSSSSGSLSHSLVYPAARRRAGGEGGVALRRVRERQRPGRQDQQSAGGRQEGQRLHLPRPRARGEGPGAHRQGGAGQSHRRHASNQPEVHR